LTGTTVKADEIRDVPAYNKANGVMWMVYGGSIAVLGIVGLFNIWVSVVLMVVWASLGLVFLVITYKRIYAKYKRG